MKILVLSQTYFPDTVATAQILSDLCIELDHDLHQVTVVTSQFCYEDKNQRYSRYQKQGQNINIIRLRDTGLGKSNIFFRIIDFVSYSFWCFWYLLFLKRGKFDLVIGMTSPPLIAVFGVLFKKWKNYKFFYWIMDLQPELAIESGMMKRGSIQARFFERLGNYTFQHADKIAVLDHYMKQYVVERGAKSEMVHISPLWPVIDQAYAGKRMDNPFRIQHGFGSRLVVMYSGNHSYVHPLDTLLQAAETLQNDTRFLFVFVGGGVRKDDVTQFKAQKELQNIVQLPYQARKDIHISLGASDFQVVILGNGQVGYTHPNKIYGAMFVGKTIVYVGPEKSHVTDILERCPGNISVGHQDTQGLVDKLLTMATDVDKIFETGNQNQGYAQKHFDAQTLKQEMVEAVVSTLKK